MLRHVAGFGIALSLAGCTEQVFLDDVRDGGSDLAVARDAPLFPVGDAFCGPHYVQLTYWPRAAQLVIMLDRSSAMQASFGGGTRETSAEQVLLDAIGGYQGKIKFGFEQFPPDSTDPSSADCQRSSCCAGSMEVTPTFNALPSISGLLQCGGTPSSTCPSAADDSASYAALEQVRDWYNNKSKYNPSNDDRYLLLVTAAEPSCSALANSKDACSRALSAASDLSNSSWRVVVLSVGYQPDPGSSCLIRISQTGSLLTVPANANTLYTPASVYELNNAVTELVSAVASTSCTFDLSDVPPSGADLVVSTGPNTTIPQVDSTDKDGWSFANPSHTTITFSGTACDEYANSKYTSISVGYTCSTCGGSNSCWQ